MIVGGSASRVGVEPETNTLSESEELKPRHSWLVFANYLPPERGKAVAEGVEVALMVLVLVRPGGYRFERKNPTFRSAAVD